MSNFVDLFAGIGGFHLGLKKAGFQCVGACEIDEDARVVYGSNHGIIPEGDICTLTVPDQWKSASIVTGGFPCQPYSISGKRKGLKDERGQVFFELLRVIKEISPRVIFLENVKNLNTHDEGKTLKTILRALKKAGYWMKWKVLNAAEYGSCTARVRLYMVGFKSEEECKAFNFPNPEGRVPGCVKDVVGDKNVSWLNGREFVWDVDATKKEKECIQNKQKGIHRVTPLRLGVVGKGGQGERIYSIHGPSITLSAQGGGVGSKTGLYKINGKVRRLTVNESLRLMGFPKEFSMMGIKNPYKPIGNAVVVDMIYEIGLQIKQAMEIKNDH